MMGRRPGMTWMTFEQRERVIGMLTTDMSAWDIAQHFQRHESTISQLLNRFQQTGNVADQPRSGRRHKIKLLEDRFLTTSSWRNRFLSSWKLVRLLRNATGTRVCDRTVRNRLHVARFKACCSYIGIQLMLRHCETRRQWANMIMPVHTLRGIPRIFNTSIRSLCFSGLQDHRISLPLNTYGTTSVIRWEGAMMSTTFVILNVPCKLNGSGSHCRPLENWFVP